MSAVAGRIAETYADLSTAEVVGQQQVALKRLEEARLEWSNWHERLLTIDTVLRTRPEYEIDQARKERQPK